MVTATTLRRGVVIILGIASRSNAATLEKDDILIARTASELAAKNAAASESAASGVCEARTINYITHTLPQSCLTSSWPVTSVVPSAASVTPHAQDEASRAGASQRSPRPSMTSSDDDSMRMHVSEPAATTFMSFEDWKEMMLRRAGQDPQALRSRRMSEQQTMGRHTSDIGYAELGEEGEISLNFENLADNNDKGARDPALTNGDSSAHAAADDAMIHEDGKATAVHLSKDAGKTCKERFSYSSFDAGATVLKTSPGAKNAKAILVENKDTYMLLECDATSKYVIVELSDDISVDTIVLANFEFFSSMVRHFRVSVSDRYPVKLEKWRELGTFEARNSRDIQPFLVENPQIWAKYVRIEFLTHFGNEYYCPISLLRIHGSRMLDSWKESESSREEEALIDGDETAVNDFVRDASQSSDNTTSPGPDTQSSSLSNITPWKWPYGTNTIPFLPLSCPANYSSRSNFSAENASFVSVDQSLPQQSAMTASEIRQAHALSLTKAGGQPERRSDTTTATTSTHEPSTTIASTQDDMMSANGGTNDNTSNAHVTLSDRHQTNSDANSNSNTTASKVPVSGGSSGKPRNIGTSGAPAGSPTMQEGFFNAITKRLQHVESNLTLSLKYVEDQSRHLREALQLGEQKQQAKISLFLDQLNETLMAELRNVREQYDQIWQSTVLALESQRDRSERDMMALSTRLNLLADEVVFQKRMAIVQAIILLSCLFLIIFSRGVSLPSLAPLLDQAPISASVEPSPPATNQSHQSCMIGKPDSGSDPPESLDKPDVESLNIGSASCSRVDFDEPHLPAKQSHSAFQRLSPPLSPAIADEPATTRTTSAPNSHNPSTLRSSDNMLGMTRKPLPSLPEHPIDS